MNTKFIALILILVIINMTPAFASEISDAQNSADTMQKYSKKKKFSFFEKFKVIKALFTAIKSGTNLAINSIKNGNNQLKNGLNEYKRLRNKLDESDDYFDKKNRERALSLELQNNLPKDHTLPSNVTNETNSTNSTNSTTGNVVTHNSTNDTNGTVEGPEPDQGAKDDADKIKAELEKKHIDAEISYIKATLLKEGNIVQLRTYYTKYYAFGGFYQDELGYWHVTLYNGSTKLDYSYEIFIEQYTGLRLVLTGKASPIHASKIISDFKLNEWQDEMDKKDDSYMDAQAIFWVGIGFGTAFILFTITGTVLSILATTIFAVSSGGAAAFSLPLVIASVVCFVIAFLMVATSVTLIAIGGTKMYKIHNEMEDYKKLKPDDK